MNSFNFLQLAIISLIHISTTSSQPPYPYQYPQYVPQYQTQPITDDQFTQQQQQIQQHIEYFNRQQIQNLHNEMQAVHQESSAPHFDFNVNGNYTDLEKASEQFIDVSNMMGKQKHQPKVIKITKTVAVKVPVVKYVKVPVPVKPEHPHQEVSHQEYGHFPVEASISVTPHKPEKYIPAPKPRPAPTPATPSYENSVFDTKPYYARDPNDPKTMIKYIPVPVYTSSSDSASQHNHVSAAYSHGAHHHQHNQHEAPRETRHSHETHEQDSHETHEHHHHEHEHRESPSPYSSLSSNYHHDSSAYEHRPAQSSPSSFYHYQSENLPTATSTSSHVYHPHPTQQSYHHQPSYHHHQQEQSHHSQEHQHHHDQSHQGHTHVRYVYE